MFNPEKITLYISIAINNVLFAIILIALIKSFVSKHMMIVDADKEDLKKAVKMLSIGNLAGSISINTIGILPIIKCIKGTDENFNILITVVCKIPIKTNEDLKKRLIKKLFLLSETKANDSNTGTYKNDNYYAVTIFKEVEKDKIVQTIENFYSEILESEKLVYSIFFESVGEKRILKELLEKK